jgi:hypothetical protein
VTTLAQRLRNWAAGVAQRLAECGPEEGPWKDHILTPLCVVSGWVSGSTWLNLKDNKEEQGSRRLEAFVVGWLVVLCLLLFLGPASGCLAVAFAWLGMYRLQDLVFASLDNVFGLTQRGTKWKNRSGVRPAVIALWNIVQVIVIFSLGYQNLAGGGTDVFEGPPRHPSGPSGSFGFLHLSWTTLFPPGSGYTAISTPARVLVMAESASGLLIIGLTLAALLSRIDKDEPPQGPVPPPPPPDPHTVARIRNIAIIIFFSLSAGVVAGFTCGVLAGMLTSR